MLSISYPTCEYQVNPLGLGEKTPRFGWQITSDQTRVRQKAYQLVLADDTRFENPVYDSGLVHSDQSAHVTLPGVALHSLVRYYWRVRVRDQQDNASEWSETAWFEPLYLAETGWPADFITPESSDDAGTSKGRYLRKTFQTDREIVSARLLATALGLYEVSINGRRVGEDLLTPGWTSYLHRLQIQTYDVTGYLTKGANAIGAMLGTGWYKGDLAGWMGRRNVYGKQVALSLQLILTLDNGQEVRILTDESWQTAEGPILMSEFYHGETYDARLEMPGWDQAGFDDSLWLPVQILEQDKKVLVPQDGLAVRHQESLPVQKLIITPKGEKVLDFGQNLAGRVIFHVKGKAGDRVVLQHAEILDKDGNFYTENMRSAKCRIEYTLRGDTEETFEPHFTFQGFRFVQLVEWPGEIDIRAFAAAVIHTDFEETGTFSCSNDLLNQLHHNISWGLKGNFIDVPTDCPQRDERLGWTGDAQVFIRTASFLRMVPVFYKKWLRDMSAEQLPDGGIPFVIPDVLSGIGQADEKIHEDHSSTGWGDAAVICPWTIWQVYGDRAQLAEQYPGMKAWVEYIRSKAQDGVLWNTGFHFGDWVALDAKEGSYFGATPNDLTATAFYAYSTELLVQAADALGHQNDATCYRDLHARIVKAYQDEFFTPTGRLAAMTQTAHILSLRFGLVPDAYRPRTIAGLLALLAKTDGHLETGFLGTPYFCQVLSDNGCLDQAYALLLKEDYPSWLYQVKMGATTIWEHWDGIKPDGSLWSADMNSFNHYAYGSIGDWMYRHIGGINLDPAVPGYKHSILNPLPGGGLTAATASLMTLYGLLSIAWQLDGQVMTIKATVPHNTTATLILPGTTRPDQELGSGTWSFEYEYQA